MNTTLKVTFVAVAVVAVVAVLGVGFAFAQGMSPWSGPYGMMGSQGGVMVNYGNANQDGTPAPNGMMGGQSGIVGNSYGMMNGQGMMGGMATTHAPARRAGVSGVDMTAMHAWMSTSGGMHDLVWGGLADALGLTQDELSAQIAGGQTPAQIAETHGLTQAHLAAVLETSVKAVLDQAVADGALTQAQADQMVSRMAGNYELERLPK